jgi:hypothetical protein
MPATRFTIILLGLLCAVLASALVAGASAALARTAGESLPSSVIRGALAFAGTLTLIAIATSTVSDLFR